MKVMTHLMARRPLRWRPLRTPCTSCGLVVEDAPVLNEAWSDEMSSEPREPAHRPPRRLTAGLPPTAGAAVMSTGILSTAAQMAGLRLLSWVLLALAVLWWWALGAALLT